MKNRTLLSSVGFLAIFIMVFGFQTEALAGKEKFEEKFEKTVALSKDGKVILRNIAGDIEVKTWDKGEVKIDALKVSKASSLEKAKENAAQVKIEILDEGNTVRIETDYPDKGFKNADVSVSFDLMIPTMASADVKSVSGDVALMDVGGEARVESVSGDVACEKIGGSLKASSVSGNVRVTTAGKGAGCKSVSGDVTVRDVDGDVYLNSVSGDIVAEAVKGSVEAETVSGDVDMTGITGGKNIEAKTLSGDAKYDGEVYSDGRYKMTSHSGDIRMMIPSGAGFDLEARTFSGTIQSDFEIKMSGTISKKKISGTINGGGAEVAVKTFSGDIHLIKK